MIEDQSSDDRLLADAKIFNPVAGQDKAYVAKGFGQIYSYMLDYNQPFGYLVIFKTCEEDLSLALTQGAEVAPFAVHNKKTIFFVVIDIFPHDKPASKRGKVKSIQLTLGDLVQAIDIA